MQRVCGVAKWIPGKLYNSSLKISIPQTICRNYHNRTEVFGYKPQKENPHEVDSQKLSARSRNGNVTRFIEAFRYTGHRISATNPYRLTIRNYADILPLHFGLRDDDPVDVQGLLSTQPQPTTVRDLHDLLREVYASDIAVEAAWLHKEEEKEWLWQALENTPNASNDDLRRAAFIMTKSQTLDHFLGAKFPTFKRYGCEGAESHLVFVDSIFRDLAQAGVKRVVIALQHRGRLNLLTGLLRVNPRLVFRKIRGKSEFPEGLPITGDVISHLPADVTLDGDLRAIALTNPSHLEAVNPVSLGHTRGLQWLLKDGDYSDEKIAQPGDSVFNLQLHGDAAFAGQGVNQESLALTLLPHYRIGGSVHLIVNNQLGFTTPSERGSSGEYGTSVAAVAGAPVLHVRGDRPSAVYRAARIAYAYQRQFRRDVIVNLNCFRRWGHNEADDPTMTNPQLYRIIESSKSVPDAFAAELEEKHILRPGEANAIAAETSAELSTALEEADKYSPPSNAFRNSWSKLQPAPSAVTVWNTGIEDTLLHHVALTSVHVPKSFNVHSRILRTHVQARRQRTTDGSPLDWATAEAVAFGSLMWQGFDVRISGQDVGRATFAHRHAMLVDQDSGDITIPLNQLECDGKLEVANSPLSEFSVLGFEYGMSTARANLLPIWEAQFGDFFNTAQCVIDTFIVGGEAKWLRSSGLVMVLPHGYDGMGPEHSSCRVERFLQMSDAPEATPGGENVNLQVAQPTTAAQYFHLLRRQMLRPWRKPLVIVSPKLMLRMAEATSPRNDFGLNTSFRPVLADTKVRPSEVRRVILASGKHCLALEAKRAELGKSATHIAIVRLEELSPFPTSQLLTELGRYAPHAEIVWSQEEPRNMGAWSYVQPRCRQLLGRKITYVGRPELPTVAVGIGEIHKQQAEYVIDQPFQAKLKS